MAESRLNCIYPWQSVDGCQHDAGRLIPRASKKIFPSYGLTALAFILDQWTLLYPRYLER